MFHCTNVMSVHVVMIVVVDSAGTVGSVVIVVVGSVSGGGGGVALVVVAFTTESQHPHDPPNDHGSDRCPAMGVYVRHVCHLEVGGVLGLPLLGRMRLRNDDTRTRMRTHTYTHNHTRKHTLKNTFLGQYVEVVF